MNKFRKIAAIALCALLVIPMLSIGADAVYPGTTGDADVDAHWEYMGMNPVSVINSANAQFDNMFAVMKDTNAGTINVFDMTQIQGAGWGAFPIARMVNKHTDKLDGFSFTSTFLPGAYSAGSPTSVSYLFTNDTTAYVTAASIWPQDSVAVADGNQIYEIAGFINDNNDALHTASEKALSLTLWDLNGDGTADTLGWRFYLTGVKSDVGFTPLTSPIPLTGVIEFSVAKNAAGNLVFSFNGSPYDLGLAESVFQGSEYHFGVEYFGNGFPNGTCAYALISICGESPLTYDGADSTPPAPVTYNLTFDANGGTLYGQNTVTFPIEYGESYASATGWTEIPVPVREGYTFKGWNYGGFYTLGSMTETYAITEDGTFVAQWEKNAEPTPVVPGFIITVENLQNARDLFIVTNDDHGEYTSYRDIKYSDGFTYSVRATRNDFTDVYSQKVPVEGDYTVYVRYNDGTPDYHYTVTMTATGTVTVPETTGHYVTFTPGENNVYDLKVIRVAYGAGLKTTQQIKSAAYNWAFRAAYLEDSDYLVDLKIEGVYSYVAEFVDGTATHGEFTVYNSGNRTPTVTANRITDIGKNVDVIRYAAGDHSDWTMKEFKNAGASAISGNNIDRVSGTYTLKSKLVGKYTFCFHYKNTGAERTVVFDISDIPNSYTVNSYAELVAAVAQIADGGEIILGRQIRRNENTEPALVINKNITIDMNGKELTNTKGSDAMYECFVTIDGATVEILNGSFVYNVINGGGVIGLIPD